MTQPPATFKSFEPRPGHTPCLLPPRIEALVGTLALPGHFTADDLREMAKFREIPNVHGVQAYAVERPWEGAGEAVRTGTLPEPFERALVHLLEATPLVLVQGRLLPHLREPMTVQAIVPQAYAHLATMLRRLLHPWATPDDAAPEPAVFSLLVWPEPLRARGGSELTKSWLGAWEGDRDGRSEAIVIGHDDPALLMRLIAEAAGRWAGAQSADIAVDAACLWAGPVWPLTDPVAGARRIEALDVDTVLIGVPHDGEGHFPALEQENASDDALGGWVVPLPPHQHPAG